MYGSDGLHRTAVNGGPDNLGVGPDNYIVDDVLFIAQQYHYT